MSNDMSLLSDICQQSIVDRFEALSKEDRVEVNNIDNGLLTEKITLLPYQMQSLLFMKHIFQLERRAAEDLLSIPHGKRELKYAELLLARSMGLAHNQFISDGCIKQAVQQVLDSGISHVEHEIPIEAKPRYSSKFRRRLKDIKAAQEYKRPVVLKRIGIGLVAAILSFAMALTASAALREAFFDWLVETFPRFSQFSAITLQETGQPSFERLQGMSLNYIPDGFVLVDTFIVNPSVGYDYKDSAENFLSITARMPTGGPIQFDTENSIIEEVIYHGQTAYWWERDQISYFILQKDGYEISISGMISYDEAVNIADNIKM